MTSGCVKGALKRNPFQNVESIRMESIEYLYSTRLDHPLVELHLKGTRRYGTSLNHFQLTDLSRFHTLRIGPGETFYGLNELITSLAPALQHLEVVQYVPASSTPPFLLGYGTLPSLNFNLRNLEPLVNLTSFTARFARTPWVRVIKALATSSAHLRIVDLHGSQWVQSNDTIFEILPQRIASHPLVPKKL